MAYNKLVKVPKKKVYPKHIMVWQTNEMEKLGVDLFEIVFDTLRTTQK